MHSYNGGGNITIAVHKVIVRIIIISVFIKSNVILSGSLQGLYFAFCLLFGLAMGSVMILFSVLITEYLGLVNLPLAVGVHCLINGLTALPRQHLIREYSLRAPLLKPSCIPA